MPRVLLCTAAGALLWGFSQLTILRDAWISFVLLLST
jgi:hypothetical protein